jgi:hypothetical protein
MRKEGEKKKKRNRKRNRYMPGNITLIKMVGQISVIWRFTARSSTGSLSHKLGIEKESEIEKEKYRGDKACQQESWRNIGKKEEGR